jgi:hypothetical protein
LSAILLSMLAAVACGGTTSSNAGTHRGSDGGAAGSALTATAGRVIEGTGGAPSSGGSVGVGGTIVSVGGTGGSLGVGGAVVSLGGSGGTVGVGGSGNAGVGGTVGVGGGGGAPSECPLFQPAGVCATAGITCVYDYFDGCLCQSTADYYCEPSPECWGTGGTTGMGGMTSDGGIGAASGESGAAGTSADWVPAPQGGAPAEDVDMPAPTVTICTCDDVWACTMTWL